VHSSILRHGSAALIIRITDEHIIKTDGWS